MMNEIINLINQDIVSNLIDEQRENIIINPPRFSYTQEAIEHGERFKKEVQEYKDVKGRKTPNIDIEKEITENYKIITAPKVATWKLYRKYVDFTKTIDFKKYVKYNFNVKAIDNSIEIATANKQKLDSEIHNKNSEHSELKQKRGFFQRHFKIFRSNADKKISQEKSLLKRAYVKEERYIYALSKNKHDQMSKIATFEHEHEYELNNIKLLPENLIEQRNAINFCKKYICPQPVQKSNPNETTNVKPQPEQTNASTSQQPVQSNASTSKQSETSTFSPIIFPSRI